MYIAVDVFINPELWFVQIGIQAIGFVQKVGWLDDIHEILLLTLCAMI